jgi:serine/threonine protein kinase
MPDQAPARGERDFPEANWLDLVVGRFQDAWNAGQRPVIDQYLPTGPDRRSLALVRLIAVDLHRRLTISEVARVEEYLQRYPELARDTQVVFGLIKTELTERRKTEPSLVLAEYFQRFPAHRERLDALIAADAACAPAESSEAAGAGVTEDEAGVPDIVGRHCIQRLLGTGGFGRVYLAYDKQLERAVAIKVVNRSLVTRAEDAEAYLAEARVVAGLDHPNIVPVYDVGRTQDGLCYVVSKYVEGSDLSNRLRVSRLSRTEATELVATVAEALHHAHKKGLVHRDVKPANILLDAAGTPYVADFGLALREQDYGKRPGVYGTPAYMSPEQASGEGDRVDGRSDVFSLGVVFYELLTGRRPFRGDSFTDVLIQVATAEVRPPRQIDDTVPIELERICLRALAKRASERYTTAKDLATDLRRFLTGAPETDRSRWKTTRVSGISASASTASAMIPAAAESTSDPKELAKSDVVITYSKLDDQPLLAGRPGWISNLHHNLRVRVAQLSGKQVAVVKHSDNCASSEIESEVLKEIPNAKTVVSVLSPPFAHSDGCHRIVESFWKGASGAGRFEVDNRSRLLNVVKTPVDTDELPPELRALYTSLIPYEFFERDPLSGRLREFDEALGNTALQRFHERVYDVAFEISHVLKYLGDSVHIGDKRTAHPKTIFLAATTSDLEPQRDQLRRELSEMGHTVIPRQPLPLVASELVAVVQNCLKQADIAIHFVGEYFGLVPEATDLSMIAIQNQVAARFCDNTALKRLIWIPKGLIAKDERQASFIRQLQSDPRTVTGAELIADTLENLKVLLRMRWEREQAEREKPPPRLSADGTPRVYLICGQKDEAAVEPLEDFFYEQGIEISLPGFEADESEAQQIHIQNLVDCDAALIYYGAAGMHWVDFKIRELQKASGYRDSRPIAVSAVYIGPPLNHRKERFKSVSTKIIRQVNALFDAELLTDFVATLRQAKGSAG